MTTLAERIHELTHSDDSMVVLDHLRDEEVIAKAIEGEPLPENIAYEMLTHGFIVGLAFALTPPEPLEPLWSRSARAHEVVDEVRELEEQRRKDVALRMAREQQQRAVA